MAEAAITQLMTCINYLLKIRGVSDKVEIILRFLMQSVMV